MDDLARRDLEVFWHPCSQMRDYVDFPPLPIARAEGVRLYLEDGRALLDAIASWWCKSLGHGHPRLRAALVEQAGRFEHVIAANTTHEALVGFCERLLALANGAPSEAYGARAPAGRRAGHFGKVFLAENGSTAVEVALKMALQAQAQRGQPQRTRFAAFAGGYHGETLGALSVGDLGLYAEPYRPLMFPVAKLGGLPARRGPDDPRWLDAAEEWPAFERALAPLAGELAAIVYEPVLQAAGGMRLFSPDLLVRLRAWARAHDVFLVADEIAAGLFRLGAPLATHLAAPAAQGGLEAALPDFAVLSKGLTGGVLPLAAVLTTDEIHALFDADYHERRAFLHSNTYTGHALAVAVARAALEVYADEDIASRVHAGAAVLGEAMRALVAARPALAHLRTAGLVAAVDLVAPDGASLDPRRRTGYAVFREAVRRGALLRPLGDTMYLFPPLVTAPDDLRAMVAILGESVDAVM